MKEYVTTLLLVSIFSIIVSFILPDTKLKRYITVVIGVILVSIIIEPIIAFVKGDNVINTLSVKIEEINNGINDSIKESNSTVYNMEMIRNTVEDKLKKDILNICSEEQITVNRVSINVSNEYLVSRVNIYISDTVDKNKVGKLKKRITDKYNLDEQDINIIKGE
jgi:stage III sporulation protein AF